MTCAKRTAPAPNALCPRQTHRTRAKRTTTAPNAPRPRQTHRARAKRTLDMQRLLLDGNSATKVVDASICSSFALLGLLGFGPIIFVFWSQTTNNFDNNQQ